MLSVHFNKEYIELESGMHGTCEKTIAHWYLDTKKRYVVPKVAKNEPKLQFFVSALWRHMQLDATQSHTKIVRLLKIRIYLFRLRHGIKQ